MDNLTVFLHDTLGISPESQANYSAGFEFIWNEIGVL
jgi:hypothetical protein